jgi:hypothetical protein
VRGRGAPDGGRFVHATSHKRTHSEDAAERTIGFNDLACLGGIQPEATRIRLGKTALQELADHWRTARVHALCGSGAVNDNVGPHFDAALLPKEIDRNVGRTVLSSADLLNPTRLHDELPRVD